MKLLTGYWRTLGQYWRDPKGRHDIIDYGRAAVFLLLTILGAWGLMAGLGL